MEITSSWKLDKVASRNKEIASTRKADKTGSKAREIASSRKPGGFPSSQ